jgi:dihydrofolate reductase
VPVEVLLDATDGGHWVSWGEKAEVAVMKVSVDSFSISEDGFGAGPHQGAEQPLGVGGRALHDWIFATKSGRSMIGDTGGSEGVDDAHFRRNLQGIGSVVMGRNMFGPVRGPWEESDWRGWWGDEPPFRSPVFVLTHFERPDLVMGETTFHFVTGGMDEALRRARDAAADGTVHVGGGVATIRQLLDARVLDELHLDLVPIRLGSGERLLKAAGIWPEGYEVREEVKGEGATHVTLIRREGR